MNDSPPPARHESQPANSRRGQSLRWWLGKLAGGTMVLAAGVLVIVLLGVAQRAGWISAGGSAHSAATGGGEDTRIYTCPMHPQVRQPGPGRCFICGMELVPADAVGGEDADESAVRIQPAARRLANIQTATVELGPVESVVETIGSLAIDESRLSTIASYIDGRIERLFADYTGVRVAKGDHLAVIYSPELYSAQVEYIESRRSLAATRANTLEAVREAQQKLVSNSRQRLVELGMTEEQLATLEESGQAQSRMTIFAPMGGTVVEKPAVEGVYVDTGEPIYRIADLSTIWLLLELFPEDAAQVRFGQQVSAEVQSLRGEQFQGRVAFIAPTVNARTRTVSVRVELRNENHRLRPGDYATARIHLPVGAAGEVYDAGLAGRWISPMHPQIIRDEPGKCPICGMDLVPTSEFGYATDAVAAPEAITVPRSAVLMAGANSVVYVETEPGRFELRPVVLGPILQDRVVIRSGLAPGEQVATDGNFLIDSQMQLAGKPSLIDPSRALAGNGQGTNTKPVQVTELSGQFGEQIEEFLEAYGAIQLALANDRPPPEKAVANLTALTTSLQASADLPQAAHDALAKVALHAPHLTHGDLAMIRVGAFKTVSNAVIQLAAAVRGEQAAQPLSHLHCPMVAGGDGDWLQPGEVSTSEFRNPYMGQSMLTCGERVRVLPPATSAAVPVNPPSSDIHAH